jgi:hypothetical protein
MAIAVRTKVDGSGTPFTSNDAEKEVGGFSVVKGMLIVMTSPEIP